MMSAKFMKEMPSHRKLEMHISRNLYSTKVLGHIAQPVNSSGLVLKQTFIVIANLIFYILEPIFYQSLTLS